jgi:hypothetical protein
MSQFIDAFARKLGRAPNDSNASNQAALAEHLREDSKSRVSDDRAAIENFHAIAQIGSRAAVAPHRLLMGYRW